MSSITGDTIIESSDAGSADAVHALISYTLAERMEHLILQGEADINGAGNDQAGIPHG